MASKKEFSDLSEVDSDTMDAHMDNWPVFPRNVDYTKGIDEGAVDACHLIWIVYSRDWKQTWQESFLDALKEIKTTRREYNDPTAHPLWKKYYENDFANVDWGAWVVIRSVYYNNRKKHEEGFATFRKSALAESVQRKHPEWNIWTRNQTRRESIVARHECVQLTQSSKKRDLTQAIGKLVATESKRPKLLHSAKQKKRQEPDAEDTSATTKPLVLRPRATPLPSGSTTETPQRQALSTDEEMIDSGEQGQPPSKPTPLVKNIQDVKLITKQMRDKLVDLAGKQEMLRDELYMLDAEVDMGNARWGRLLVDHYRDGLERGSRR